MLDELGLTTCADTIVGGPLLKGISGGERKRTSVGVELVVRPAMVFLDEPTSGLDSFSAVQLCQVLKKVADAGASVLFTIHQPSSEIFDSFDRMILMNKGRVMYQGSVVDVPMYFEDRGHPLPPKYNPADWIMNVAQSVKIEELDKQGYFPKDERQVADPFTDQVDGKDALGITLTKRTSSPDYDDSPHGMFTQIHMLFLRELKNMTRDKRVLGGRLGFSVVLSVLIGVLFIDVGEQPSYVPEVRIVVSNLRHCTGICVLNEADLSSNRRTELEQSFRRLDHGNDDGHDGDGHANFVGLPPRASNLCSRILNEPLLGRILLSFPFHGRSCCYSSPGSGDGDNYLLVGWIPIQLRHVLLEYLWISHGQ
jgi:hypothetical protein